MLGTDHADSAERGLEEEVHFQSWYSLSEAEVQADPLVLEKGKVLEMRTRFQAAGIAPNPLNLILEIPHYERSYILCEPDLRVTKKENIWAIGGCTVNIDSEGSPYPATAQHAVRQGK